MYLYIQIKKSIQILIKLYFIYNISYKYKNTKLIINIYIHIYNERITRGKLRLLCAQHKWYATSTIVNGT